MNTDPTTPRQTRRRLNKMEAWYRSNAALYTPEQQVLIRSLFEYAHLPEHVNALAQKLKELRKSSGVESTTPTPYRRALNNHSASK